ncbi:MAG: hypothetical protein BZ135_04845 [Methanosphaera sp. rholeuAM6]|nr:MAG: hypothetical protein BZ135_04845 [Methanosphaera sp. rholeuAM6]
MIKILQSDDHDESIIQKLRKPAYKLLYDDVKLKEKLDFLYHLREELKKSRQINTRFKDKNIILFI